LENSPNSDSKEKKLSLDNFSNSGSKFPNSFVPEKNELEKKNKLRGSKVLKISNVQVQTHFLLKTMDTKKNSEIEIESRLGSKSRKGFSRTKFCYTKTII
jgi:hypothetical protein